jgi:hypothetical protein
MWRYYTDLFYGIVHINRGRMNLRATLRVIDDNGWLMKSCVGYLSENAYFGEKLCKVFLR